MNIKSVAKRIAGGDFQLGRFKTVRDWYSGIQRLREIMNRVPTKTNGGRPTLFPNTDIAGAVRAIRDDAVFMGLRIPAATVAEIEAFCRSEPLLARNDPDGRPFHRSDVIRGGRPTGGRPRRAPSAIRCAARRCGRLSRIRSCAQS